MEENEPTGPDIELARALREEVDRVRRAERATRAALGELQGARERLEALVGASLESLEEAAPEREVPEGKVTEGEVTEEPEVDSDSRFVPLLVGALVVLAVTVGVGWLAMYGDGIDDWGEEATTPPEIGEPAVADDPPGETGSPAEDDDAAGEEDEAVEEDGETEEVEATGPLAELPAAPEERAALYDSLWSARADVFDPLLDRLEEATTYDAVEDAVAAWREGATLEPLAADRLHSALLQLVLADALDRDLTLDGQVLRNPCRGASCGALVDLWERAGDRYGLDEPPDDVARNSGALAAAERAVLLEALARARPGGEGEGG